MNFNNEEYLNETINNLMVELQSFTFGMTMDFNGSLEDISDVEEQVEKMDETLSYMKYLLFRIKEIKGVTPLPNK